MFYDRFKQLCDRKGVSCNKAALEIGLSNATPTKWKKTGATPAGDTLDKIAAYFGISVDFLLYGEKETPTASSERQIAKEDIMFALARGREDVITDSMFEEIMNFADYVIQREVGKKKSSQ